jgi:hypothetical protein
VNAAYSLLHSRVVRMLRRVYCNRGLETGSSVRLSAVWLCAVLYSRSISLSTPKASHSTSRKCLSVTNLNFHFHQVFFKMLLWVDKYKFGYTT